MRQKFKSTVLLFISILCFFTCINPDSKNKKADDSSANLQTNDEDYSCLNQEFLPSKEVIKAENAKKKNLLPEAYQQSWITKTIEEKFNYFGYAGKRVDEVPEIFKEAITANIVLQIVQRENDYQIIKDEKYNNIHCDISSDIIKKGDVILAVTRNPMLMGIDSETTVHHALLCIVDPANDGSMAFITTNGFSGPEVKLYPLSSLKHNCDILIVLRSYYPEKLNIASITDYALNQLGKGYNTNFTDKYTEDKFYCTQLVWRAYLQAGLNIDENDRFYNDYCLALASDIFRSPYLYIAGLSVKN